MKRITQKDFDKLYYSSAWKSHHSRNFQGADLSGLNFLGKNLNHCRFYDCNLSNCDFSASDLSFTKFYDCNIKDCLFDGAILKDTDFYNTDFMSFQIENIFAYYTGDDDVTIGCSRYTIKYWLKFGEEIAEKHGLTRRKIEAIRQFVRLCEAMRDA